MKVACSHLRYGEPEMNAINLLPLTQTAKQENNTPSGPKYKS